ncbi:cytochrome C biogenesis protein [Haloprofundus marisrubri]|uniref:Cytochrome C biogenesis protein n=1 Tax=Haloprofundus marisrubri TaxID=1514971 RepID=A0A0W1R3K7_9EURY|nr:cytochrome c biogenesis protein CcdA [Haloprofundus marisrubri]KTG07928.1 cytochrome C biogenesis protein [Haloprofundus marisrubri]
MLGRFVEVFLLGAATPLTAACALPLYPGFLAYLSSQDESRPIPSVVLAALVTTGVVAFMGLIGVVFSFLLQVSLTLVVEVVSPVAFAVLAVFGGVLLVGGDLTHRIPTREPPQSSHPVLSALGYGFFFGAIVLPCNPGLLALFFARAPVLFDTPLAGFVGFLCFGLGMGTPLLAFGVVSQSAGQRATRWLARRSDPINRVTGAIMLLVSAYYLLVVFDVAGVSNVVEPVFEAIFGPLFDATSAIRG